MRLVPPVRGADVSTLGVESDGTRRLVAYGLRLLTRPDGSVETASQFFPLARNVQAVELPARLGSGFVFSLLTSGRTALWRAQTWTGALEPFAELDFELERLVAGFDRLYAQARRTGEWIALDARTGKGTDLGGLPRSPNFGAMTFVDEWFGAVELPVRGTVVSFDAGNRWHGLGLTTLGLGQTGNELLIVTPDGRRALASDGTLRALENADTPNDSGPRRVLPESPLGVLPLRTAVLRGFPDGAGSAVVAAQGALARVRLSDGRVLEMREKALPAVGTCTAIRLERGFGFVCGEPHGKTHVFAFEAPLSLRLVESFETPRAIHDSGNGALVIRGRCEGTAADALAAVHCIRAPDGTRWELVPKNAGGVERVIALRDGRAALLTPPRSGTRGTLVLAESDGDTRSVPLTLAGRGSAAEGLLAKGFWIDGFVEGPDGSLRGWVTGQGVFAGIRVGLDGRVRVGPPQRSIERALLSGERALLVPAAGIAEQTTDGGMSWTDAELPVEIEQDPSKAPLSGASTVLEQGCSAIGCSFLGWLRVGWNGPSGPEPLPVAAQPPAAIVPSLGGGRWLLRCSPTGEASPPVSHTANPRHAVEPHREEGQPFWQALLEEPPPPLPRGAVGYDTGNEGQIRGYVWAPEGTEFGKTGQFQVAVADRFRIGGGVWKTRPVQSPWDDAIQAAEVFGFEGSSPSVWNLALDSSGRAGVLSISARGTTDLFAVEEARAPRLLVNASRHGIGAVTSAVRVDSSYYVSAQEDGRAFRVFALEGGKARLIGQYSDVALGRTISPVLVRSTRGGAIGIWGRGPGWFVYPLDAQNGVVDPPIEITPKQLSKMPPPCAPDEEGYLLEGPVGMDPYADFVDGAGAVSARAFEGRFIASAGGLCLRELSARAEGAIDTTLRAKPSALRQAPQNVPLVLSDRASGGRRHAFRCSP